MNLPTREQNPNGLHARYRVTKANGQPDDDGAEFFVLRLDDGGESKHVGACRAAILTYAEHIRDHLPELAEELTYRYG